MTQLGLLDALAPARDTNVVCRCWTHTRRIVGPWRHGEAAVNRTISCADCGQAQVEESWTHDAWAGEIRMKRWLLVTPEYETVEVINEYGGPTITVADVLEIEAESARDAVALGVRYMLTHRYPTGERFQWVHDQRGDGLCPYSGVRAIEIEPK